MNTAIRAIASAVGAILTLACTAGALAIDIDQYGTARIRVDSENGVASPSEYGEDWEDAYLSLQDALSDTQVVFQSHEEVTRIELWVHGTHYPGDEPQDSFALLENVEILGGFAGTETARSQRDVLENETILSGVTDPELDATLHVVTADSIARSRGTARPTMAVCRSTATPMPSW